MSYMTDTARDRDIRLENFVAELTRAVYSVVLRRGLRDSWLKAELDLWKALEDTVQEFQQLLRPLRQHSPRLVRHAVSFLRSVHAIPRTITRATDAPAIVCRGFPTEQQADHHRHGRPGGRNGV